MNIVRKDSPPRFRWLFACLLPVLCCRLAAGTYLSHAELTARLRDLASLHPPVLRLQVLATSLGGREVWRVELGSQPASDTNHHPSLLVVAGLEGNDLASTSIVLGWITKLLGESETNASTRQLLATTTIHVVPRMNVDAAESYFATPRIERLSSLAPVDDDHDGLVDEDGPEDLNGDGLITAMRVQDPAGEYILDPVDPRLLLKADKAKGERGSWRILSEGVDNDHDEAWNEDDVGGVNFNRNFPFGYRFFEATAGRHPVSEVETRALADFVVGHDSIGVVFAFSGADNLAQTPKSEPGGKRPPSALHEGDLPILKELGKAWRERLGLKKELATEPVAGAFADWIYYDRGRLALSARAWSPAMQMERSKSGKTDEGKDQPKDPASEKAAGAEHPGAAAKKAEPEKVDGRNEEERAWLKWLDQHAPESFVPWREVSHPDFPGKKVEIGGHAPFSRHVPPADQLADLVESEGRFLTELAGRLPRVGFRKVEAKALGHSVYELIAQVENTGYLPTALAHGIETREVSPTRLVVHLDPTQFLAGRPRTTLGVLLSLAQ